MKKLGKYGKKVSCVVIGMLCAAAIGACGSTQSGSQDEKDVRNDISVYEEGADLEGTLTYGTLFIEPQTQHMIDLFMKEHPGVKIETKVVFDNDVTDEQYNEGLNTLLTELASDQRADIYDATYLPSEIKTKGSGYFEDLNQYIDADPNFNRDDYYDNILRAAEVDGKLYQIPEGFYYVMLRLNRNITDELNYEVPDEMDINDLYELYQQAKPIADDDFTIDVQNNIYVFLPMTEDRAYLKKEEVNFDSENYVDFLRKMQELYQYQPSYATHAFTDIKSFSGKSVLLNTFTNLLEGSPSGMFEETDTATKPILLKSTDGKIPFCRIGEDFSMSSGCKDKALAWEFIKFCIGQKQFEFEDANSDSYYRNFFTYGSMLNKENTRQLVAYQLENDDDTAEKWEAYNEKMCFILPSFIGIMAFYIVPFLLSLYFAVIDNMMNKEWVGLKNFKLLFENELFLSALRNTGIFCGIAIPLGMAIALLLVLVLKKQRRGRILLILLLIPLIVPSGTVIAFWKYLFERNGFLDGFLQLFGKNMFDIENSRWAILIIILMYLWKNISFSIVLFWSGINWIPQIYHEQCQLDGATGRQEFQYITWILLKPTTLVVLLMSIVNSFKVFKEIYMLYGAYPSPYVYMLQHYMNNQFLSLNMQKLSAAAWCMFLILGIFLGIIYRVQRKNLDYL